jgi:hypothetical protein
MNISKFSFAELCSNNSGKTSAASTSGIYLILLAGITFAYGIYTKDSIAITNSVLVLGMGTSLILGKKIMDGKNPVNDNIETETNEENPAN